MRPLIFAAAAIFVLGAGVTSTPANAKEYAVKYLGSKALAGTCARGGGKFHQSTAISHSCTYKNGNVRDCSSKSKTCVVITPGKARVQQATGVGGAPPDGGAVGRSKGNLGMKQKSLNPANILDPGPGPGSGGQNPAATGRGSAPPPAKIY